MSLTRAQRAIGVLLARDVDSLTAALRRELSSLFTQLAAAAETAYLIELGEPTKGRKADEVHIIDRILASMGVGGWLPLFATRFERHYTRVGSRTVKTINDALDLNVSITEPDMIALQREGAARSRLLDLEGDTRVAVLRAIRDGTDAGDNPLEVARRIRREVPAGRFTAAGSRYRATLIARTETLHAQRLASLDAYASSDVVTGVVAIDGDYDEVCAARNGREFTIAAARLEDEHPNGTLTWAPTVS